MFVFQHEEGTGQGRICSFEEPQNLNDVIQIIKKHLGLTHLRLAKASGSDMVSFFDVFNLRLFFFQFGLYFHDGYNYQT